MKNVNTILIAILLAAVGYLLFDKVSNSSSSEEIVVAEQEEDQSIKIACVNMDSLNANFQFIEDQSVVLESEAKRIQANIQKKYKQAEKRNAEIQQTTPTNQAQYDALEKELYDLQANLQAFEQTESAKLQKMQLDLEDQIKMALDTCLEPYRETYDFIFSYGSGSQLMHAKDMYELSEEIIVKMNSNYEATKETEE